jgi:adenosine deaminase
VQSTLAVLEAFAADNVVYLELRTTPRAMPAANLSKEGYVDLVLDTISKYESRESLPTMHTRLILSVDRRNSLEQAMEVVHLALKLRDRGVVGLDLCGDPTAKVVAVSRQHHTGITTEDEGINIFTPAFTEARLHGLPITVHFAEAECSGTDAELRTLLSWQPDRLGHVIHLSDAIMSEVRSRKHLGLELCLSCNVQAGMVTGGFEAHHFGEWWRARGAEQEGPAITLAVSKPSKIPMTQAKPRGYRNILTDAYYIYMILL